MLNLNIASIYVSQEKGNNSFCGTKENPFKSIEAALEKVALLRKNGANQPLDIVITDHFYRMEKPIYINNNINLVTIKGADNTVISGGIKITEFKNDIFNGKNCFSAYIPQIKEGLWFTDLFVDGEKADLTAIPKDGYFLAEKVENPCTDLFSESGWIILKPETRADFAKISNFGDCLISYCHYWVDEHSPIESYDPESGKLTMKYLSRFDCGGGTKYQLENVAEAFENQNEWYLCRDNATLYYIPRNGNQTPENIEAFAPIADKLFIVSGDKDKKADGISFANLTFSYTKGDYSSRTTHDNAPLPDNHPGYGSDIQSVCSAHGAVEFNYSHACFVENCAFTCLGLHAVTINDGCDNIRIYGNNFNNLGGGAVKITGGKFGCDKSIETHSNLISQNRISNCGRRYSASCGILVTHSYGNTISHNDIGHVYYTGISVGWEWGYQDNISHHNIIEKNHVHHIGFGKLSDMGGIYVLGVQPGTVIRNNIVHDISSVGYGANGIYTDEGSSFILIENNIVYNIKSAAHEQHYGKMNTVRNNIFTKAGTQMYLSRPEEHTGAVSEHNIFVTAGKPAFCIGYKPEDGCENTFMIRGNGNLFFDTCGNLTLIEIKGKGYSLSEAQQTLGMEPGSILADPKFNDYENNDFSLSDNSPAYALGFKKIDTSDVGVTL